jgi:hypothetical protein
MRDVSWSTFKSFVDGKGLRLQYVEDTENYYAYAFDGQFGLECALAKDESADTVDFETNYVAIANLPMESIDADGAKLVNPKLASSGRTYRSTFINFDTSDLDSLVVSGWAGTDLGIGEIKLYDALGDEITDNADKANAVVTLVTMNQTSTFDLQGFCIYQSAQPATDMYANACIAPHIPAIYGGTVELVQGCNLKYANYGNREMDWVGDSASTVTFDGTNYSHILGLKIIHNAGVTHHLQCEVIWYV